MRGIYGCILALACLTISHALTVEETCAIVPNNTIIGTPKSCSSFAMCRNGKLQATGECVVGLRFDRSSATCKPRQEVKCENPRDICNNLDDVYKPHPEDCSKYVYCKQTVIQYGQCPPGQVYNAEKNVCVWRSEYSCRVGSVCEFVANGVHVKDNATCDTYFRCSEGITLPQKCSSGYYYQSQSAKCLSPNLVDCVPPPLEDVEPILPPRPWDNMCASGVKYLSDQTTCRGFFSCNNIFTADPIWRQCRAGTHFDATTQKCTNMDATNCKYDRCDGVDKGFMTVANTGCTQYNMCTNGTASYGPMSCTKPGYPYFDEVLQLCTYLKQATYVICKS